MSRTLTFQAQISLPYKPDDRLIRETRSFLQGAVAGMNSKDVLLKSFIEAMYAAGTPHTGCVWHANANGQTYLQLEWATALPMESLQRYTAACNAHGVADIQSYFIYHKWRSLVLEIAVGIFRSGIIKCTWQAAENANAIAA